MQNNRRKCPVGQIMRNGVCQPIIRDVTTVSSNINRPIRPNRGGCNVGCDIYNTNGQLVKANYHACFSQSCSQWNESMLESWLTQWGQWDNTWSCGGSCYCLNGTYNETDGYGSGGQNCGPPPNIGGRTWRKGGRIKKRGRR